MELDLRPFHWFKIFSVYNRMKKNKDLIIGITQDRC